MHRLNGELQGVPNFVAFQKHTNNANGNSTSGNANKDSQNSTNKTKEPERLDEYIKIAKKESDEIRRDMTASLAQQRHERRVHRQDSHLAVERRRDDAPRAALEEHALGGNHRHLE